MTLDEIVNVKILDGLNSHKIQEAKFTEQHHNDSNTTSSQNNTMIPSNFDTPSHVTSKNKTLSNTIDIGI